jgi:uncharacterized membrane protein
MAGMERMNRHHHWLDQQIPQWVDKAIITEGQAIALRALYPPGDSVGLGRLLITGIGAIMIGLGVILLFAYNWDDMGKVSKLTVIFSGLIGAHLAALYTRERHHVASESLFALGTMLMGAGIFLVGQIYHLDSHYPNAIFIWSLGALALAWVLPSLTQAFMAVALITAWHLSEVMDFAVANHAALPLLLIGLLPLVWRLHSPILARFVSVSLFVSIGFSVGIFDEHLIVTTLLLTAAALIGLEQVLAQQAEKPRELAVELAKPARWVLFVLMYLLTFSDLTRDLLRFNWVDYLASSYFIVALLATQVAFFFLLYQRRVGGLIGLTEIAVVLVLLPPLFYSLLDSRTQHALLESLVWAGFNLLLLAVSVWLMIDGARHANRQHMLRGSILFALLAMARYTDLFDSLLARAVVFLLVGVALFAVNHFYQRNKRAAA